MNEQDARARLERMVAHDDVPRLDSSDIDALLIIAKRADRFGVAPDSDDWRATWNLAAAAAEGWRWKAGKVAGAYTFGADGGNFNRSDMHRHCLETARHYDSISGVNSIEVMTTAAVGYVPEVVGNGPC